MKSLYEQTLGRKDIEVLHNGAEQTCSEIPPPKVETFSEQNPFVLCFIGGLFSHLHGDCIEDLFEAVSQIRKKRPWIVFHLYGQRQPAHFLEDSIHSDGCKHYGIVMPLERKFEIMEKAHCFVIPSSFNKHNHRHYRYSFPTKLLNSLLPDAQSYLTDPRKPQQIEYCKLTVLAFGSMSGRYQSWWRI